MEVSCGEAKLIIQGSEILHVFQDEILDTIPLHTAPNLADWIAQRAPKTQAKKRPSWVPHKHLTFRVVLDVCGFEYNQTSRKLEKFGYITIDIRPNKVIVAIPTAKAIDAELVQRKTQKGSYLWHWQKLKEVISGN